MRVFERLTFDFSAARAKKVLFLRLALPFILYDGGRNLGKFGELQETIACYINSASKLNSMLSFSRSFQSTASSIERIATSYVA